MAQPKLTVWNLGPTESGTYRDRSEKILQMNCTKFYKNLTGDFFIKLYNSY